MMIIIYLWVAILAVTFCWMVYGTVQYVIEMEKLNRDRS